MIITDGVHLVSTESEQELHEFAQRIGLKRIWYQNHPTHPHYDMTVKWRVRLALKAGAQMVTRKEVLTRAWWFKDHWLNRCLTSNA